MYYAAPASEAGKIQYVNVARDLARYNSKNEEVTDREGHVYGYLCKFKFQTTEGVAVSLYTAPNTWKMRNAFRKFHAYRNHMFAEAGIEGGEMGRYGKTIRPLLDTGHKSNDSNTLTPFTSFSDQSAANKVDYDQGDWSYTRLATTPIFKTTATPTNPTLDWADDFNLMICEENVLSTPATDQSSGLFSQVGMIHSYNLDRMEIVTPDATGDEVLATPANPLAALRAAGNQAAGQVLELAVMQESEEPPYDLADNGNSINTPLASLGVTPSTGGTVSFTAFLPAGLGRLYTDSQAGYLLDIQVIDKILCKDME
jgi:hypothetical protein